MTDWDEQLAGAIIDSFDSRPEMLVQILNALTDRFGYIPDTAIAQLASALNLSRADVHGVVSYYHDFRTSPPGRNIVKVCQAEACQAMGARALTRHAEKVLGPALGDSNADYSLDPVYCLGNCACTPAVMVNGKTWGRVSTERFDELIDSECKA